MSDMCYVTSLLINLTFKVKFKFNFQLLNLNLTFKVNFFKQGGCITYHSCLTKIFAVSVIEKLFTSVYFLLLDHWCYKGLGKVVIFTLVISSPTDCWWLGLFVRRARERWGRDCYYAGCCGGAKRVSECWKSDRWSTIQQTISSVLRSLVQP
jgi:hypothetical protein